MYNLREPLDEWWCLLRSHILWRRRHKHFLVDTYSKGKTSIIFIHLSYMFEVSKIVSQLWKGFVLIIMIHEYHIVAYIIKYDILCHQSPHLHLFTNVSQSTSVLLSHSVAFAISSLVPVPYSFIVYFYLDLHSQVYSIRKINVFLLFLS